MKALLLLSSLIILLSCESIYYYSNDDKIKLQKAQLEPEISFVYPENMDQYLILEYINYDSKDFNFNQTITEIKSYGKTKGAELIILNTPTSYSKLESDESLGEVLGEIIIQEEIPDNFRSVDITSITGLLLKKKENLKKDDGLLKEIQLLESGRIIENLQFDIYGNILNPSALNNILLRYSDEFLFEDRSKEWTLIYVGNRLKRKTFYSDQIHLSIKNYANNYLNDNKILNNYVSDFSDSTRNFRISRKINELNQISERSFDGELEISEKFNYSGNNIEFVKIIYADKIFEKKYIYYTSKDFIK